MKNRNINKEQPQENPERMANKILIRRLLAKPMRKKMNFLRVKCGKGSSL